MKKENLAIFWLTIIVAIFSGITLLFDLDKGYMFIAIACLLVFIFSLKLPKWMYFVIYHSAVFGGIFYVIWVHWVPIFEGWSGGFLGINILGGIAWVLWFITYASFLTGLIYSVASTFTSTELSETDIAQLSVFGTLDEWGKNQKNGRFGLFLGMPPFMVKIKKFSTETKTIDTKDESIQVQTPTGGQISIVIDGQFQHCFSDTLIASKNQVTDDALKNLYKAAATSWFADPTHKYATVDDAKAKRDDILCHIVSEMTSEALRMYGKAISGIKIINLETSEAQRKQQDANAALLEKIVADEKAEMMSLTNHYEKVAFCVQKFKDITGETTITPATLKTIEEKVMTLDKTIKRTDVKGAGAYTRV